MVNQREYYMQRNCLFDGALRLEFDSLLEHMHSVYRYAQKTGWLEIAFKGFDVPGGTRGSAGSIAPLMDPSPKTFLMLHLGREDVWPLDEYWDSLTESELFTFVEIMYDKVAVWDYNKNALSHSGPREVLLAQINNLLELYGDGYYLVPESGFIMSQPNIALKEQLSFKGDSVPDDVFEKMRSASRNFYRFDSDIEAKRKAIASLADILEPLRKDLKIIFNSDLGVSKNDSDKVIFDIVNKFNIRHNGLKQRTDYSKGIWYEWMMQYYTSVIIAFYRIKNAMRSPDDVDC